MSFFLIFFRLLNQRQKLYFFGLIFLSIIVIFFELLSIGLVIPLITIILDPLKFLSKISSLDINIFFKLENILSSEFFVYYFLLVFVFLFTIKNILIYFTNYLQCKFVENIEVSFSSAIIYKYLCQKFPFFSNNSSASLVTKLSIDFLNFTRGFVSQIITITSEILIILSFTLLIIFLELHRIGFIFLIFFIVGTILMRIIGKLSDNWGKKRKYYDHLKISLLNNAFRNIKSIIIDNKRDLIVKNFDEYVKELSSIQKKILATKVLPKSIFEIFGIISLSFSIMFMTFFEYDKNYILTATGFFIAVAYRIIPSFQKIIYCYQTISLGKVVLKSIDKDLALNDKTSSSSDKISFEKQIELKNLSFKYPNRESYILEDLSITIPKGKSIGIYGDSGEGKSTFVDILSCLVPSQKGKIIVDEVEIITDELIRKWQNQISYVTQDTILFNDTIKNNIIFSSNSASVNQKKLDQILINTQLNNFIKNLPLEINTQVGELGNQLSGGQKKRIGIARALYKNPELIIFDEATNGLDKDTEEKILSMILNLKSELTIILISHDMNVLKNTDEIFKFSKGKLIRTNGSN